MFFVVLLCLFMIVFPVFVCVLLLDVEMSSLPHSCTLECIIIVSIPSTPLPPPSSSLHTPLHPPLHARLVSSLFPLPTHVLAAYLLDLSAWSTLDAAITIKEDIVQGNSINSDSHRIKHCTFHMDIRSSAARSSSAPPAPIHVITFPAYSSFHKTMDGCMIISLVEFCGNRRIGWILTPILDTSNLPTTRVELLWSMHIEHGPDWLQAELEKRLISMGIALRNKIRYVLLHHPIATSAIINTHNNNNNNTSHHSTRSQLLSTVTASGVINNIHPHAAK